MDKHILPKELWVFGLNVKLYMIIYSEQEKSTVDNYKDSADGRTSIYFPFRTDHFTPTLCMLTCVFVFLCVWFWALVCRNWVITNPGPLYSRQTIPVATAIKAASNPSYYMLHGPALHTTSVGQMKLAFHFLPRHLLRIQLTF